MTSKPSFWCIGSLVVCAVLSACGGDSHDGRVTANAGASVDVGSVDPPPLSSRDAPAVAVVGDFVIVFGGSTTEGDVRTAVPDGAVLDLTNRVWKKMAAGPFDDGIFQPAVISLGGEALVVGQSCSKATVGEGEPACPTGTRMAAALYDPAKDSWHDASTGGALAEANGEVGVSAIGPVGAEAFVQGVVSGEQVLLRYNSGTDQWSRVSKVDGIDLYCAAHDALVAVGQPDTSTRPESDFVAGVATFRLENDAWTHIERGPTVVSGQTSATLSCGNGAVAFVPWTKSEADAGSWLAPDATAWNRAPALAVPVGDRIEVGATPDGSRVVLHTDGKQLHLVTNAESSDHWTPVDSGKFVDASLKIGGNIAILVPIDPIRDGLFVAVA